MKKTLAVLVILLMTTALVFAGGGSQSTTSSGATKITVEVYDRGTDGGKTNPTDNVWTKWIHDKVLKDLNIDVTFQAVGRWTETVDIANLMASGSAPDLSYTYNQDMINQFGQMGGILDLMPYVDRYLPDMKKLLGADPALTGKDLIYRDLNPATGKLWSVTNYVVNVPRRGTYIRKDWLDKLGMALPTTTQQFHDALVAFKNRDPGGVGAARVIPFANGGDRAPRWSWANLIWSFIYPKLSDRDTWISGWDPERAIALPGYKEGVRTLNAWYNEGLIYHDFPLMKTSDDFNNLLKSGVVGAISEDWQYPYRVDYNINVDLAKNVPGAEFVPIDPFQASDGKTYKSISDRVGMRIFVPASSKNPVAALQYLNWLCKYENFHYIQVGDPGINHMIINGVPQVMARPAGDPWIQNSANNIDYTMSLNGIEMGNKDMNATVLALGYPGTPSATIVNAVNLSTVNGRAPVVYQALTTKLGAYGVTLEDKVDALLAQAVTAPVANFDRVWDAGLADYLSSGGQEIIDERKTLWK